MVKVHLVPPQSNDFAFASPGKRQHLDYGNSVGVGIPSDFAQSNSKICELTSGKKTLVVAVWIPLHPDNGICDQETPSHRERKNTSQKSDCPSRSALSSVNNGPASDPRLHIAAGFTKSDVT